MTRPKRKRAERRLHRVTVLLSLEEHVALTDAAKRAGMGLSTWLRWLGLKRSKEL